MSSLQIFFTSLSCAETSLIWMVCQHEDTRVKERYAYVSKCVTACLHALDATCQHAGPSRKVLLLRLHVRQGERDMRGDFAVRRVVDGVAGGSALVALDNGVTASVGDGGDHARGGREVARRVGGDGRHCGVEVGCCGTVVERRRDWSVVLELGRLLWDLNEDLLWCPMAFIRLREAV